MALQIKGRVLVFLAAALLAELWSSIFIMGMIPTDSALTYYPSQWSYVGEHFAPWFLIFLPLAIVSMCAALKLSSFVGWKGFAIDVLTVAATGLVAVFLTSRHLWTEATMPGERLTLWWKNDFREYMWIRVCSWAFGYAAVVALGYGLRALAGLYDRSILPSKN